MSKLCALCGSDKFITFHHLIPKSCPGNKWFKKHFDKADMKESGIDICRKCHTFIHKSFRRGCWVGSSIHLLNSARMRQSMRI